MTDYVKMTEFGCQLADFYFAEYISVIWVAMYQ